ncbi:hypothetical protein AURDEDRAFT_161035 [Auricularia subglabra TFB-10046 SS5]|nr:hypothetical protein AURDEDRAFT_161035 [Auricularia subglabra TFB-10046 SS5]
MIALLLAANPGLIALPGDLFCLALDIRVDVHRLRVADGALSIQRGIAALDLLVLALLSVLEKKMRVIHCSVDSAVFENAISDWTCV